MLHHVVFEHTHSVFKSRVIVFAWGDVTCAAYPESNDCVLLSLSSSTVCTDLRCLPAGDKQTKDQLLCAPHGGVGHRAALLTSISEAFLPELGAGHSSADPEGCSKGCRAACGEERQRKMMGTYPDGKTPWARAEHLLPPMAASGRGTALGCPLQSCGLEEALCSSSPQRFYHG